MCFRKEMIGPNTEWKFTADNYMSREEEYIADLYIEGLYDSMNTGTDDADDADDADDVDDVDNRTAHIDETLVENESVSIPSVKTTIDN